MCCVAIACSWRALTARISRSAGPPPKIERDNEDSAVVVFRPPAPDAIDLIQRVRARCVIGANGAISAVDKQNIPGTGKIPFVFACHEVVKMPATGMATP